MRRASLAFALALVTGSLAGQMAWGPRPPGVAPPARHGHAMAWDPVRREIVLFGGFGPPSTTFGDTWVWDGEWTQRSPAAAPRAVMEADAAFDAARGVTVMFGGYDPWGPGAPLDETWEWDGTTWTLSTPVNKPPGLSGYGIAYDPGRQRIVLFGGSGNAGASAEVWEWDGTDWLHKTASVKPSARWSMQFCFDIGRGVCLMFGGYDGAGPLNDTWTWNGGAWTKLSPPESPPARSHADMVYDPTRDRVVLFGGLDAASYLGDTWEWDGTTWIPRSFGPGPPPRHRHAMEFDHATGRVVLFGGLAIVGELDDSWEYFNLTPARFEPLGGGCAGTAGTPVLGPEGTSKPWIGERFKLELLSISPAATPFLLLGASNEQWSGVPLPLELGLIGSPGCWLQVSVDISVPLSNQGGLALARLPIPYDYRLLGAPFFTQAFVLDPGGTPPAAVSNAGLCLIGAK